MDRLKDRGLNCAPSHSHIEALSPNVCIFREDSRRRLILNKIVRIDPNMTGLGTLSEEEETPEIFLFP